MATPNYSYEKRQRELAKKRKKEEKAMRKSSGLSDTPDDAPDAQAHPGLVEGSVPPAGEGTPTV